MHGGMMAGMGLWMLVWGLAALMLLVLAVLGIAALVRHLSNRARRATRRGGSPTRSPRRAHRTVHRRSRSPRGVPATCLSPLRTLARR